jgi:hypothetical protein
MGAAAVSAISALRICLRSILMARHSAVLARRKAGHLPATGKLPKELPDESPKESPRE